MSILQTTKRFAPKNAQNKIDSFASHNNIDKLINQMRILQNEHFNVVSHTIT